MPVEEKDVTETLLSKEVKRLRKDGEVVYCLDYSKDVLDFEILDFMFLTKYCFANGLTMHRFETPPRSVLDFGCGAGLWTIEAAKQWKESHFIGFDFLNIQPQNLLPDDVAQRIEWIHGNFLDPLPFPSNHFDLIHIVRPGFHVPEDEGSIILEETYRVLKPGGYIEVVDEDLIFPHARLPSRVDSCGYSGEIVDQNAVFPSSVLPTAPGNDAASQIPLNCSPSVPRAVASNSGGRSSGNSSIATDASSPLGRHDFKQEKAPSDKPRDHSRLQMAWEQMLQNKFLNARCISGLAFYLQGYFKDVKTHPPLEIALPAVPSVDFHRTVAAHRYLETDKLFDLRPPSSWMSNDYNSQRSTFLSSWAPMHLARTVSMVIACKKNIWAAYRELFDKDLSSPPLGRDSHAENSVDQAAVRDAFEEAWTDWESDMKDRIGMREKMHRELKWSKPLNDAPARPVRRDVLKVPEHQTEVDLCRNIQGFVVRKPDPS